jgi:hypothetical protein
MNKSNIKNYKLISLENHKQLGTASINDNYNKIELKPAKQAYTNALAGAVRSLMATEAFPLVCVKDLTVKNGSEDFWIALKQTLLTTLKIVVSENIL